MYIIHQRLYFAGHILLYTIVYGLYTSDYISLATYYYYTPLYMVRIHQRLYLTDHLLLYTIVYGSVYIRFSGHILLLYTIVYSPYTSDYTLLVTYYYYYYTPLYMVRIHQRSYLAHHLLLSSVVYGPYTSEIIHLLLLNSVVYGPHISNIILHWPQFLILSCIRYIYWYIRDYYTCYPQLYTVHIHQRLLHLLSSVVYGPYTSEITLVILSCIRPIYIRDYTCYPQLYTAHIHQRLHLSSVVYGPYTSEIIFGRLLIIILSCIRSIYNRHT